MDDETDPSEGLAPASIFLFGREFNIGPLNEGEQFDLHAQLRAARRLLWREFYDLEKGHRPKSMDPGESIDDAMMLLRKQIDVLRVVMKQVPNRITGGGITD